MNGLLSLLTPEQQQMARQEAQSQGLIGLGSAMLQAAAGVPGQRKPSIGQIIGQAAPIGLQAYRGGFENTLQDILRTQQIQELRRRQADEERIRQARDRYTQRMQELSGGVITPSMALASGKGPTPEAAATLGQPIPDLGIQQQMAAREFLAQAAPATLAAETLKAPEAPGVVGEYAAGIKLGLIPKGTTLAQYIESKRPQGTTVNVSTEKSYGGALAGKIAEQDAAKFDAASSAPRVLETVYATRKLLDTGNVITGIGANQRLDLARFGQLVGVGGQNNKELIANTQLLLANRAQATLDAIKSSGLGSGQGFTNKDREFLENAKLGNITYSPEALKRQLDIEEKVARASITSWNSRIQKIPQEARQSLGLNEVTMPTAPAAPQTGSKAPAGVRQELWNVMTPEQKALWQP